MSSMFFQVFCLFQHISLDLLFLVVQKHTLGEVGNRMVI